MRITYDSPIGTLFIEGTEKGISQLIFSDEMPSQMTQNVKNEINVEIEMASQWIKQLDGYFHNKNKTFDLNLDLRGTDFQIRVWNELLKIPFGKTISYKELTLNLGNIKAIRAVAAANGANPISIIVPCHRVIGSDGSLTGYGGGLWRKRWLLDFEGGKLALSF